MEKLHTGNRVQARHILKLFMVTLFMVIFWFGAFGIRAEAAAVEMDGELLKEVANIGNIDNYYLDMEETGLTTAGYEIIKSMANSLFSMIKNAGQSTVLIVYYCIDFNIAELFSSQINSIQSAMKDGIFEPLFIIGYCGVAFLVIKNMIMRDSVGIFSQLAKVVFVLILSNMIVTHTSTVLTYATNITKSISTDILVSMGGGSVDSTDKYASQCAGVLWNNLVHQPWIYIEFLGQEEDEGRAEAFLAFEPDSPDRLSMVEDEQTGCFGHKTMAGKIGFMVCYLIPFFVKILIYIILAVLGLAYQLFAVFYVLLAPVVLILMLFPGYEHFFGVWLKKLLETQMGILLMTMIMGLLVKVDDIIYTTCAGSWGWLVVLIVQVVLEAFIVLKREEILGMVGKLQKGISHSGYAAAMMRNGNANAAVSAKNGMAAAGHAAEVAGKFVGKQGAALGRAVGSYVSAAGQVLHRTGEDYMSRQVTPYAMKAAGSAEIPLSPVERPVLSAYQDNVIQVHPVEGHLERVEPLERPTMLEFQPKERTGKAEQAAATEVRKQSADRFQNKAVYAAEQPVEAFQLQADFYRRQTAAYEASDDSIEKPAERPVMAEFQPKEQAGQNSKAASAEALKKPAERSGTAMRSERQPIEPLPVPPVSQSARERTHGKNVNSLETTAERPVMAEFRPEDLNKPAERSGTAMQSERQPIEPLPVPPVSQAAHESAHGKNANSLETTAERPVMAEFRPEDLNKPAERSRMEAMAQENTEQVQITVQAPAVGPVQKKIKSTVSGEKTRAAAKASPAASDTPGKQYKAAGQNIPRESISRRLQAEHASQTAQVQRPSTSAKSSK